MANPLESPHPPDQILRQIATRLAALAKNLRRRRLPVSGIDDMVLELHDGTHVSGTELQRAVDIARSASGVIPLMLLDSQITNQAVIEQAAIAGAINPDIINKDERSAAAATYIARRLDTASPEPERGWHGAPTADGGLVFERTLRGVVERHIIDGALIRSAEARKLDALAEELQAIYLRPAMLRIKDISEIINGPTELLAALPEAKKQWVSNALQGCANKLNGARENADQRRTVTRRVADELTGITHRHDLAAILELSMRPMADAASQTVGLTETAPLSDHVRALVNTLGGLSEVEPQAGPSLAELRRTVPGQKVAPAQFEIASGKLRVVHIVSPVEKQDEGNVQVAREALVRSGEKLLEELARSNCDRRLTESFQYLQSQIAADANAVAIGLANLQCVALCDTFQDELSDAVVAMLRAHSRGIDMFAAQFPDWNRFVENAVSANLKDRDIISLQESTEGLVQRLESQTDVVDPEVPKTIKYLRELLSHPGKAALRAAFAFIRTLENLVSKIYSHVSDLLDKTAVRTVDALSSTAAKVLVVVALMGATSLTPLAGTISELAWIKGATAIIQKEVGALLK